MTIRREYGDGHDPEEEKWRSGMPYCYFCEHCGLEIEQSAGVAANHEKACAKRKAAGLDPLYEGGDWDWRKKRPRFRRR